MDLILQDKLKRQVIILYFKQQIIQIILQSF